MTFWETDVDKRKYMYSLIYEEEWDRLILYMDGIVIFKIDKKEIKNMYKEEYEKMNRIKENNIIIKQIINLIELYDKKEYNKEKENIFNNLKEIGKIDELI